MAGTLVIDTLKASSGVLATQNGMTGIGKGWCKFNGNGSISGVTSFNVSSVTRNSAGNYTVTFSTAMADANYATEVCVSYDLSTGSGTVIPKIVSQTTGAVNFLSVSPAGSPQETQYVAVSISGN